MTDDERRTELVVLRDPGGGTDGEGRSDPRSRSAGADEGGFDPQGAAGFDPRQAGGFDPRQGGGFDPRGAAGFDPRIAGVMLDPESLARDLHTLCHAPPAGLAPLELVRVQPVDMFPHTRHIEAVASLRDPALSVPAAAGTVAG